MSQNDNVTLVDIAEWKSAKGEIRIVRGDEDVKKIPLKSNGRSSNVVENLKVIRKTISNLLIEGYMLGGSYVIPGAGSSSKTLIFIKKEDIKLDSK